MNAGASTFESGAALTPLFTGRILRHHLVEWCAAENDYYNIHYDDRAAREMGLAGAPVQGTYKFALLGQMLDRWLAGRGTVVRISASYRQPDFEGATLEIRGEVTERQGSLVTVSLVVVNEVSERTTTGEALVRLHGEPG